MSDKSFANRITRCLQGLAITLCITATIVSIAGLSMLDTGMEDVMQWLPTESDERATYDQFVSKFGSDDFLLVSWPGCTLDDPRCDQVAAELLRSQSRLIKEAMSGPELVRTLDSRWRTEASVVESFRGFYFGADRATCLIVALSRSGTRNRRDVVALVQAAALEAGVAKQDLILGGYPRFGVALDDKVRASFRGTVLPSCLLASFVALLCIGNLRFTALVLVTSGLATGLSIAFVSLSGAKWGALTSAVPTLAYILSLSSGMHLLNYARDAAPNANLLLHTLRIGWKPTLLSSVTTMTGMLSLRHSEFAAIRDFGLHSAIGVFASLLCSLLIVPVGIAFLTTSSSHTRWNPRKYVACLQRHALIVVAAFAAGALLSGVGLPQLSSDLEMERCFVEGAAEMQEIRWLESAIGPLEQTDLLVTIDRVTDRLPEQIAAIRRAEQVLSDLPYVRNTLSVSAWLPPAPRERGVRGVVARTLYRKRLDEALEDLIDTGYLRIDDQKLTLRISLRFGFFDSLDLDTLTESLPSLAKRTMVRDLGQSDIEVEHTGLSLLFHDAQRRLTQDLFYNFSLAFLLILPLMMLALRSVLAGFLSMLPNLYPAVVAYGLLGWIGYPLDLAMAIVASVALGIAVDDTTHFVLRFQELRAKHTWVDALPLAFQQCSLAMIRTTIITCAGLFPILGTQLATMSRFATMLIGLMALALLSDLVLMPALLTILARIRPQVAEDIECGHR